MQLHHMNARLQACVGSARLRTTKLLQHSLLGAALAVGVGAATLTAAPSAHATPWPDSVFTSLDYGLYWYSNQSDWSKATGATNPKYDASRPTVIYIHGWQPGGTKNKGRETFDRSADSGISQDLTSPWKRDGWNMGIFYWNQFADEDEVKDAEAKIWSVNGPRKMRWRKADGSYSDTGINSTAAQLFLASYKQAMANYTGNDIRLVGHSLGSQMVIVGAKLISDAIDRGEMPAKLLPKRIALLDPAFLKDGRAYLNNRWTGEVARDYVDALKAKGVIFESLRSSGSSSNGFVGDANTGLMNKTAFREVKPWYFGMFDFAPKHKAAVWIYWWEYAFAPPLASPNNRQVPGAATSNSNVQTLMNLNKRYVQDQGAYSKTPSDDTYKEENK